MTAAPDLTRLVPGFDFLQGLLKNAGGAMPGMGQWVAPTLDPQELEKRIQELKTVHFWLEQNAKLLATTIQAMEVQRMTLSTLQSMNLPFADLGESLKIKMPSLMPQATAPAPARAAAPAAPPPVDAKPRKAAASAAAAPSPAIDPMQWWGALTQQFTELASRALKDGAATAGAATAQASPAKASGPPRKAAARKRAR